MCWHAPEDLLPGSTHKLLGCLISPQITSGSLYAPKYITSCKVLQVGLGLLVWIPLQTWRVQSAQMRGCCIQLEGTDENKAAFLVQYMHGIRLKLAFHLVYSSAEAFQYQDQSLFQWRLVSRDQCHANCQVQLAERQSPVMANCLAVCVCSTHTPQQQCISLTCHHCSCPALTSMQPQPQVCSSTE